MVRGAIKDIDQLALMSGQIGVSTEKLSGLSYAVHQMADVSAGTFDTALRRMTRRIAEAADETGGVETPRSASPSPYRDRSTTDTVSRSPSRRLAPSVIRRGVHEEIERGRLI